MGFFSDYIVAPAKGIASVPGRVWDWGTAHPKVDLPHFEEDRGRLQGYLNQGSGPYVGKDPYAGNWANHIGQLEDRAAGRGPSVAGDAYRGAAMNSMAQQYAMSQGGRSAGAGRQSAMMLGGIQQGLAKGYGDARNQEMTSAEQALTGALGGADAASFQRDKANQDAWLDMLAKQLGLSAEQLKGAMAGMAAPSNFQTVGGLLSAAGIGGAKISGPGGGK
jgi:hypothetical protein